MIVGVSVTVMTGLWLDNCLINTNSLTRLNYNVGREIVTVAQLVRTMYLLGYVLAGQLPLSGAQHGELPSAGVCE